MLPNEIEPFANYHIEKLDEVRRLLIELQLETEDDVTIDNIKAAINKINSARNGFVRFKVCMADEVRQKNRMRDQYLELRFPKE